MTLRSDLNETTLLREAVDELTLPTYTKVGQEVDGRERVTRVEHPPLLRQLDDAIRGVMSETAGGSASSASTRSLVNGDAFHQFTVISTQIRDWCRMAGVEPRRDPVEGLRAWHAATLAADISRDWYTSQLRRWAGVIRAVVNPHRELSITAPCPACKGTRWENQDGDEAAHPVVVTYRPDDVDILRTATARCRACGMEWRGLNALRALAFELETEGAEA